MSISAEANLPVCPKWILMNLPCWKNQRNISDLIREQLSHVMKVRQSGRKEPNTYKTGRVVVPYCFGISKSLHGRIGLNDLIFQSPLKENTGKSMLQIYMFSIKMGFSNLNSPLFWWRALAATERDMKPVRFGPFL